MLPEKLILRNFQCPGDILMLTAAVRDLHETFPDVQIGVHTRFPWLWENNPHIETHPIGYNDPQNSINNPVRVDLGYQTPHQTGNHPAREHFIYAFHSALEHRFDIHIKRGIPYPDIHITEDDTPIITDAEKPILLINAGSKPDFPIKQWVIPYFQEVVDQLQDKYTVVQIGESVTAHHPKLKHVVNMIDLTYGRDLVRLMRQAAAVITGVSFPMHLCAALNAVDHKKRRCVVLAGHREDRAWEAYPDQKYLQKPCKCVYEGCGCWNRSLPPLMHPQPETCSKALKIDGKWYARCMADIKPEDVAACL